MIARFRLIRSTQAVWSRRLAFFCVPLLLLTALLNRTEHIDPMVALTVIGLAVALATVAAALAAGALVDIWRRGHRGLRDALLGMGVGALVLTIPVYVLVAMADRPALHDIATDPGDPPEFIAAARIRGASENPVAFDPRTAAVQKKAYPGIGPVELAVPAEEAYLLLLDRIVAERWRILDERPPAAGLEGRIEAVATTLLFGFRDDVVITVAASGDTGAVIQMRSASRYGRHDLGRNADRIYDFLSGVIADASPMAVE